MSAISLKNYALGRWIEGRGALADISSAVTGRIVARAGSGGLDFQAMASHARDVGGANLRKLTFQQRAAIVKALGSAIMERKEELYALNFHTGATRKDVPRRSPPAAWEPAR